MVNSQLTLDEVVEMNVTFQPSSTGLDNALVDCDLTRILAQGSWIPAATIDNKILPPVSGSSHRPSIRDQHS